MKADVKTIKKSLLFSFISPPAKTITYVHIIVQKLK